MSATWPEDSLGEASLGDVFDEALRPKVRSYVLQIPASVEDQGPEAVAAWVREHHPGYPVIVVPEQRPLEDWLRKVQAWQRLSPEERARQQREWLAEHRRSQSYVIWKIPNRISGEQAPVSPFPPDGALGP